MHRSTRLSVLIVVAALGHRAIADDASDASDLFERGRELTRAGNDRDACPLFEKSLQLVPALGTELNLARCWAATGRLVDGLRLFEGLVDKTAAANQPQREALARQGLADLTSRIPHVAIRRGAITALVQLDGKVVDVGDPVPVDPGHHAIAADGAKPIAIDIAEGETKTVELEAVAPPAPASNRDLVYGLGGGGAVALLAGTITGITVIRERNAGRDHCAADTSGALICDARGVQLLDRSHTMSHVTTGLFVVGVGLAAAAVVIELRDRRVPVVWASSSSVGVAWEGAW